jgi:NADPH:quinone reductase
MKAIRVHRTGGPEVLALDELPPPSPRAGEVLVRVEAAGVNFMDVYQRTGAYGLELPATLGAEGAGVVEAVGDGGGGLPVGARVAWANVPGSYATHVLARAERLVQVPDGVTTRDAAAACSRG